MGARAKDALLDRVRAAAEKIDGCAVRPERLAELHPELCRLEGERLADLTLATACLAGDSAALAAFFGRFEAEIRAIGKRSLSDEDVDDFTQTLLARLLVATEQAPARLSHFSGRGSLAGFVRMSASRFAIDILRQQSGTLAAPDDVAGLLLAEDGPERGLLDAETKLAVTQALGEVLGELRPVERRALRMRYLLGFSLARTARALDMHEQSVSRMVSRCRRAIRAHVHHRIAATPGANALTVTSLERSIADWLASHPTPA